MRVINLKPIQLNPVYPTSPTGPFDPGANMKSVVCPNIRTPIVPGTPARIVNNAGNDISDDDICAKLGGCLGPSVDIGAENWCRSLFGMTMAYFNKNTQLGMRNLFAIQSAAATNLQEPNGSTVFYTESTDVIPVSREFITGICDYDKYFATMAFYAKVNTLGFYFVNETSFDAFKAYVATFTNALTRNPNFPADTLKLLGDFQTLKLNSLTESLILRNDQNSNIHDNSFARILIQLLFNYTHQVSVSEFGVMPFDIQELFCPTTLVFVNVEAHMHATAKQVNAEWDIIRKSLASKVTMISNAKLSKLTAAQRAIQNIMHGAVVSTNALSSQKAAVMRFRKTPPTAVDLTTWIAKLCKKMANVAKSENSYKTVKMTFAKPNRRNPDDFNKQGKAISTKYKPDIHLYIDCSGSISEENYQDAVKACIRMAKKLNVNLYFNSFSDCLSQCVKLKTKDKPLKQIYAEFQKIPKVTGGTNFDQIWTYINASPKRKRELGLVITDFEWEPPNRFVQHPENLYYAPCSKKDYKTIMRWAENFIKTMRIIDPDCRKHVLM